MSQSLKIFTSVSRGKQSLVSRQNVFIPWVNQTHLQSSACVEGSKNSWQHVRMYHGLRNLLPPTSNCYNALTSTLNQRSMSILTDLLRRKKKDDVDEEIMEDEAKTLPLFDEPANELTEEEIQAKRNVSRVHIHHQRLIHGQLPYPEPLGWTHHTVKYKRKMFGRYGESSGVNPGILWPTRDELKERIEYEKICHPFTILEMVEKKRALRQAEKEETERRIKEVEEKMAIVDKFKEDLEKRQKLKERDANEARARREKLMEEVRRHFGYTVDPREDKFQELLAKKEKEQRKSMKEARKLEKQQKILQKLEGKPAKNTKKSANVETVEDKDDD